MSWLGLVADEDKESLVEAARHFVEGGLSPSDWRFLGTQGRAAILLARRQARQRALEDAGQDIAAACLEPDGGRAAARLMAETAGRAVAEFRARPPVPR